MYQSGREKALSVLYASTSIQNFSFAGKARGALIKKIRPTFGFREQITPGPLPAHDFAVWMGRGEKKSENEEVCEDFEG